MKNGIECPRLTARLDLVEIRRGLPALERRPGECLMTGKELDADLRGALSAGELLTLYRRRAETEREQNTIQEYRPRRDDPSRG
jgi:hypothetical protein